MAVILLVRSLLRVFCSASGMVSTRCLPSRLAPVIGLRFAPAANVRGVWVTNHGAWLDAWGPIDGQFVLAESSMWNRARPTLTSPSRAGSQIPSCEEGVDPNF